MNQEQRNALGQLIVKTAAYYARTIDKSVLSLMVDDLADLEFEAVVEAYGRYRKNPKNRVFPLPAQIRELVNPEETPESQAREIAGRIQGAIPRFGHSNGAEAREYIGPVGWSIVVRNGGWYHLCRQMGVTIQPTQFYAQIRDQIQDAVMFGEAKREVPSLQAGASEKIKQLVQGMSLKEVE